MRRGGGGGGERRPGRRSRRWEEPHVCAGFYAPRGASARACVRVRRGGWLPAGCARPAGLSIIIIGVQAPRRIPQSLGTPGRRSTLFRLPEARAPGEKGRQPLENVARGGSRGSPLALSLSPPLSLFLDVLVNAIFRASRGCPPASRPPLTTEFNERLSLNHRACGNAICRRANREKNTSRTEAEISRVESRRNARVLERARADEDSSVTRCLFLIVAL